jgi:glyoxylase-like metal-dependent hydrolase (beta-lactamase superfamily II)
MSYTGNVRVGGPADTRELPGLTVTKVSVGPMDNNAYLLRCTVTGELVLIDAANDTQTLLNLIGDTPLAAIITTHRHWDHHAALEPVQQATGASTIAHPDDAPGLPIPVTRPVRHGDVIPVGNTRLSVIHLRGHTPGSIALRYDSLMTDLETRVFADLPDGTWVYPGHGRDTTLGTERPHLPEWRARGW